MKKYLILFCLLFIGIANAGQLKVFSPLLVTCGNKTFGWEMATTAVECSAGDESMTLNGNVSLSGGTMVMDDTVALNGADSYDADVSGDDIMADTEGTLFIKMRVDTWVNDTTVFCYGPDANNSISMKINLADDITLRHESNNVVDNVITTGNAFPTGTPVIVRARWKVGRATADLQVTIFDVNMTQLDDISGDVGIGAFTVQAAAGDYYVGSNCPAAGTGVGAKVTYYYVHNYSTWRDQDK